jgi:hypothetical protein
MASREAYMQRPQGVHNNRAQANGWGTGWPSCENRTAWGEKQKIVEVSAAGVRVSVRRELRELVSILLTATTQMHRYQLKPHETGGYNCRNIDGTQTASNHSWGLAVDLNWNDNPWQKKFKSNLPVAVIPMWWRCGFFWGGWYSDKPDTMHFEYVFTPQDVPHHLSKAKELIMPFHDDVDARALIWRIEGILKMRNNVDNHAGNPHEENLLTAAINAIADDAKKAKAAATEAATAAHTAAEAAGAAVTAAEAAKAASIDPMTLEQTLERVVRRVLAESPPPL